MAGQKCQSEDQGDFKWEWKREGAKTRIEDRGRVARGPVKLAGLRENGSGPEEGSGHRTAQGFCDVVWTIILDQGDRARIKLQMCSAFVCDNHWWLMLHDLVFKHMHTCFISNTNNCMFMQLLEFANS